LIWALHATTVDFENIIDDIKRGKTLVISLGVFRRLQNSKDILKTALLKTPSVEALHKQQEGEANP